MSLWKIILTAALPIAIFVFFGLWDKSQIRKSLLCMLIITIIIFFGAKLVSPIWDNDGTIHENLLIIGIISIFTSALLVIFQKKEKMTADMILKTICLLCVGVSLYSVFTKGQASIHSDTATATLLIQSQIEKRAFFPETWQYVNGELWILSSNTFVFPFSILLKNQALARMMGSASIIIATLLGIVFLSKKLFHNNSWLLMIPLFLVFHPSSNQINDMILWQAAYTVQMLWITLCCTLAYYAIFHKNKASLFMFILLTTLLCSSGIRFAAELVLPMLGAFCIYNYYDINKNAETNKKWELTPFLHTFLIVGLPMVIGFGVYKYLCSFLNVSDGRSEMIFVNSSSDIWKNIEIYLSYLFEGFAYNHGACLFSAKGIWNLVSLVLCLLICFIVPIMQALKLQTERAEIKWFFYFALMHNTILFIIIVLLGNIDGSRYVLTTIFVNIIVSARYIYCYRLKGEYFTSILWSAAFAAFAFLACVIFIAQSRGWAETVWAQKQFNQSLSERQLDKGYATYWNAYNNEIYSDLNIKYGGVKIINGRRIEPFLWLVDKDFFSPEDKHTFLLLNEQENAGLATIIPSLFGEPIDVFHKNGLEVYVFDHDIACDMYPLSDGIIKPIELFNNDKAILENNKQYLLTPGASIYGPYAKLEAGEYKIVFEGDNLEKGNCDIHSENNKKALVFNELSRSSKKIVFDLILSEDVDDIEFRTFNKDSEEPIILYQIEVKKK